MPRATWEFTASFALSSLCAAIQMAIEFALSSIMGVRKGLRILRSTKKKKKNMKTKSNDGPFRAFQLVSFLEASKFFIFFLRFLPVSMSWKKNGKRCSIVTCLGSVTSESHRERARGFDAMIVGFLDRHRRFALSCQVCALGHDIFGRFVVGDEQTLHERKLARSCVCVSQNWSSVKSQDHSNYEAACKSRFTHAPQSIYTHVFIHTFI